MRNCKHYLGILLLALLGNSAQADDTVWAQSFALQAEGDFYQAAQVLLQDPANNNDEYAALRIGYLSYLRGNYNDAIRFYEKALTLNPSAIDAQLGITLPLMAQQRWRQVKAHMQQLLKTAPWHYGGHIKLMMAEEALADWSALSRHASQLTIAYPAEATAWVYLARAASWQGDTDKAKQAYREVLKRIPNHIEASAFIAKNS